MSICRISKREVGYTQIGNAVLNDREISYEGQGLLCYLLSKPVGWKVSIKDLIRPKLNGRDQIYRILNDLIAAGYVVRSREHATNGQVAEWVYDVFEEPQKTTSGFSVSGSAVSGETQPIKKEGRNTDGEKGSSFEIKTTGTDGTAPEGAFQFPPGFRRVPAINGAVAHPSPSNGRKRAPAGRQQAETGTEDGGAGFRLSDEIDEYHETPRATPAAAAWKGAVAEIYAILRKEFPDIGCKPAPARDRNIKRFWRDNGKTVQAVRDLCAKVKASDYLMKRNGHTGVLRLDFNWMFDPEKAAKIMAGDYENEKMAFLLEKAKTAEMVEVVISGSGEKRKVPASEIGDGKKYFDLGKDKLTGRRKIALAK